MASRMWLTVHCICVHSADMAETRRCDRASLDNDCADYDRPVFDENTHSVPVVVHSV